MNARAEYNWIACRGKTPIASVFFRLNKNDWDMLSAPEEDCNQNFLVNNKTPPSRMAKYKFTK